MKMYNLGEKDKYAEVESVDGGSKKSVTRYPSMYISGEKFPEIHNMKVGDTVSLVIKTKITGYSKREGKNGSHSNADFDIMEIGIEKDEEKKPMNEKDKIHKMTMDMME